MKNGLAFGTPLPEKLLPAELPMHEKRPTVFHRPDKVQAVLWGKGLKGVREGQ